MRVPEVWRHDGARLTMLTLTAGGYAAIESSIALPGLDAATIDAVLARRLEQGETALIKQFREAVAGR